MFGVWIKEHFLELLFLALLMFVIWKNRHRLFGVKQSFDSKAFNHAVEQASTEVWLSYIFKYGVDKNMFFGRALSENAATVDETPATLGEELDNEIALRKRRAAKDEIVEAIDYFGGLYFDWHTLGMGKWLQKNGKN